MCDHGNGGDGDVPRSEVGAHGGVVGSVGIRRDDYPRGGYHPKVRGKRTHGADDLAGVVDDGDRLDGRHVVCACAYCVWAKCLSTSHRERRWEFDLSKTKNPKVLGSEMAVTDSVQVDEEALGQCFDLASGLSTPHRREAAQLLGAMGWSDKLRELRGTGYPDHATQARSWWVSAASLRQTTQGEERAGPCRQVDPS